MNRIGIGLSFVILIALTAACTPKGGALRAPSSAAYGEAAAAEDKPSDSGERAGAAAGRPDWKGSSDAVVEQDETPRETLVRSDRERAAKPLVPAFPVAMNRRVLQDMRTVFFSFDQSELSEETRRVLDANMAWMREHPKMAVRLIGHADERGTSEYNLALGLRRAGRVRDYLVSKGILADKLVMVSYGEELPLRRGHDERAWGINRRVEFSLDATTAQVRR